MQTTQTRIYEHLCIDAQLLILWTPFFLFWDDLKTMNAYKSVFNKIKFLFISQKTRPESLECPQKKKSWQETYCMNLSTLDNNRTCTWYILFVSWIRLVWSARYWPLPWPPSPSQSPGSRLKTPWLSTRSRWRSCCPQTAWWPSGQGNKLHILRFCRNHLLHSFSDSTCLYTFFQPK